MKGLSRGITKSRAEIFIPNGTIVGIIFLLHRRYDKFSDNAAAITFLNNLRNSGQVRLALGADLKDLKIKTVVDKAELVMNLKNSNNYVSTPGVHIVKRNKAQFSSKSMIIRKRGKATVKSYASSSTARACYGCKVRIICLPTVQRRMKRLNYPRRKSRK